MEVTVGFLSESMGRQMQEAADRKECPCCAERGRKRAIEDARRNVRDAESALAAARAQLQELESRR